jgi:hypothetical protein
MFLLKIFGSIFHQGVQAKLNYWGQFSQKKAWLIVGVNGLYRRMSVTLSNTCHLKLNRPGYQGGQLV